MTILSQPPIKPILLLAGRCLLFVYGQLQPGHRQPKTMSRAWPDQVRGQLFDLGHYPAAVEVGGSDSRVHGYVLEIDERELVTELDVVEGVAEGVYRRIRTMTEAGANVWIYEYSRPMPANAIGPIARWPVEKSNDEFVR